MPSGSAQGDELWRHCTGDASPRPLRGPLTGGLGAQVGGRIIRKRIHVRIEHIRKSKCQKEIIERVKSNEAAKKAAREGGEKVDLKRSAKKPKEGYFLPAAGGDGEITTIQPLPFSDLL